MGRVYLVIDISNVHHKSDVELEVVAQYPPQDVRRHVIPRVPEVRVVVDRRSTHVPGDHAILTRNEGCFRPRQRIPDAQGRELASSCELGLFPGRLLPSRHGADCREARRQNADWGHLRVNPLQDFMLLQL